MTQLVLIDQAVKESEYNVDHIRYLARKGFIKAEKHGGIWLVDKEGLAEYERQMKQEGTKKFDPTKNKHD